VAKPLELIVAAAVFDDVQLAVFVRSWVVLSLNAPVAVNCCVLLTCIEGFVGLREIETRVAGDAVPAERLFPPQAESINPSPTDKKRRQGKSTTLTICQITGNLTGNFPPEEKLQRGPDVEAADNTRVARELAAAWEIGTGNYQWWNRELNALNREANRQTSNAGSSAGFRRHRLRKRH
jgi:hypothetical protein